MRDTEARRPPGPDPHGSGGFWRHPLRTVRQCLGWRLVLLVAAILLVLVGVSSLLALRLHRRHLQAQIESQTLELGQTMLAATRYAMMQNDWGHIEQIVSNIATSDRVLRLRLINARGKVAVSSRAEEVGQEVDIGSRDCQACHASDPPRFPHELRAGLHSSRQEGQGSRVGLVVPVENAPGCSQAACHVHDPGQSVLGILDLELASDSVDRAVVSASWQMAWLSLVTVLVICVAIGIATWRVVHRPFHEILGQTMRFADGDLNARLDESTAGELGLLARNFNFMAENLGRAQRELQAWNDQLEERVAARGRELARARDAMIFSEKMVSLGKLASIVAHEINNPLAGILVSAKLLRRRIRRMVPEETDRAKLDESLEMIERESARSGEIVRNLLLFSRKRDLSMAPEPIPEILERAVRLVRHKAELQGVQIRKEYAEGLEPVICDGNQIEQACLAVLLNAIEAMPDGGELSVRVAPRPGAGVSIEISDSGIGIPRELQERVFEPFFSTKSEGQGTGLGLSVMYGIVQRHGGEVGLWSEPGQGTRITIELPRSAVGALAEVNQSSSIPGATT